MVSSLAAGLILGLTAGAAPGPLMALVIAQTLRHGAREGVKVAVVPLVTDPPIILVSLLVLSRLANLEYVLGVISLAGGLYVLYLSYENARAHRLEPQVSEVRPRSLRKGSVINALNPHPYLFWVTVGVPFILMSWEDSHITPAMFVSSFFLLLIGAKVSLALAVGRSRSFLTSKMYVYVMRVLAAVLFILAAYLIKNAFDYLGVLGT